VPEGQELAPVHAPLYEATAEQDKPRAELADALRGATTQQPDVGLLVSPLARAAGRVSAVSKPSSRRRPSS
jgi:hypothetical protein